MNFNSDGYISCSGPFTWTEMCVHALDESCSVNHAEINEWFKCESMRLMTILFLQLTVNETVGDQNNDGLLNENLIQIYKNVNKQKTYWLKRDQEL